MNNRITIAALVIVSLLSCKKDKNLSAPPVISQLELSTTTVREGDIADTVFLTFNVEDKDADIGNNPVPNEDIFLKSDLGTAYQFSFPDIPRDIADPKDGIKASCTLKLPAAQFFFRRPDVVGKDSTKFDLYVKDRAGNESNHISTPFIYILPR